MTRWIHEFLNEIRILVDLYFWYINLATVITKFQDVKVIRGNLKSWPLYTCYLHECGVAHPVSDVR